MNLKKYQLDRLPLAVRMCLLRRKRLSKRREHTEESNAEDDVTSVIKRVLRKVMQMHMAINLNLANYSYVTWIDSLLSHIAQNFRHVQFQMFLEQKTRHQSRQHQRFPFAATILALQISCLFYDPVVFFLMQARILLLSWWQCLLLLPFSGFWTNFAYSGWNGFFHCYSHLRKRKDMDIKNIFLNTHNQHLSTSWVIHLPRPSAKHI